MHVDGAVRSWHGSRVIGAPRFGPGRKREPGEREQVRDCPAAVIENDLHDKHWSQDREAVDSR